MNTTTTASKIPTLLCLLGVLHWPRSGACAHAFYFFVSVRSMLQSRQTLADLKAIDRSFRFAGDLGNCGVGWQLFELVKVTLRRIARLLVVFLGISQRSVARHCYNENPLT